MFSNHILDQTSCYLTLRNETWFELSDLKSKWNKSNLWAPTTLLFVPSKCWDGTNAPLCSECFLYIVLGREKNPFVLNDLLKDICVVRCQGNKNSSLLGVKDRTASHCP